MFAAVLLPSLTLLALSGCKLHDKFAPPERVATQFKLDPQSSVIAVPVSADLSGLAVELEREVPRVLKRIDRKDQTCVASKKIDLELFKLKSPEMKCDIVGTVTRGRMVITGRGQDVIVTMPIHVVVHARDIGGILKQETATADARLRAVARLNLAEDWNLTGKVDIQYDWTDAPHVDFLGQRIEFTDKADAQLARVIARLERTLPRELAKLNLRGQVEELWGQAFTSLQLNESNPPVWMRVTPQELQYGGYSLSGRRLNLKLGIRATTETFVGDRPPNPERTPLPPRQPLDAKAGRMVFFVPVIADYAQLEPVVKKALVKRSATPFDLPGIGPVTAQFHDVVVYGTTGGRVAVGVTFSARLPGSDASSARGQIWLTGTPSNDPDSRRVTFSGLEISGDTDATGADLLLALANTPGYSQTIASALAQNFEGDYDELMGKIDRAIASKREGDLLIHAKIDDVRTGRLQAAGQGLYLPVWGTGTASITLAR
ncbi:MAG: DUF4403 family protein [Sphingomonadales bacterium]|nr:DUF4403 family protein [Sphingomonadales bacterium]MBD3773834.1 DUF4403 family protein [Paracoccaceae bacterium]